MRQGCSTSLFQAAVIDDVVVGMEDAVRQPDVAHELPDVLDRVELRAPRRQRHQGDIRRHDQFGRSMPPGLIEQQDGMCARGDVKGDLLEVHAHRLAVAPGHHNARDLAISGTDRAEQPCRRAPLILGCRWPSAALGPAPGELGLLADAGLVLPPQLYRRSSREPPFELCQTGGEAFLKSAMSSGFWPRCRDRAESLR